VRDFQMEDANYPIFFKDVAENFSLLDDLLSSKSELLFLQVGVYTGDATEYLLKKFSKFEKFTLYDVDTWVSGDSEEMMTFDFELIYSRYLSRFEIELSDSRLISHRSGSDYFFAVNKARFDFIYVDGSHKPKQIILDAIHAFDSLKSGGILAFDDYLGAMELEMHSRPKLALDFFQDLFPGQLEILVKNYQIWFKKIDLPDINFPN
jgi:predicted O-methyltransferase YrrM